MTPRITHCEHCGRRHYGSRRIEKVIALATDRRYLGHLCSACVALMRGDNWFVLVIAPV